MWFSLFYKLELFLWRARKQEIGFFVILVTLSTIVVDVRLSFVSEINFLFEDTIYFTLLFSKVKKDKSFSSTR